MSKSAEAPLILAAAPIKEAMRQDLAARAHRLREKGVIPRLVIATDSRDTVIKSYIAAKQKAGSGLGVVVNVTHAMSPSSLASRVREADSDREVNGIIVQLPIAGHKGLSHDARRAADHDIRNLVSPEKDVDGLAQVTNFKPATAVGIRKLLGHYVGDYREKSITLLGRGELVNAPLQGMLHSDGVEDLTTIDIETSPCTRRQYLYGADIIIAATGHPGALSLDELRDGKPKIIIDAGTAEQQGEIRGDVTPELRAYASSTAGWGITPIKGGVGPLTVHSLHENLITATELSLESGTAFYAWGSDAASPSSYADLLAYGEPQLA